MRTVRAPGSEPLVILIRLRLWLIELCLMSCQSEVRYMRRSRKCTGFIATVPHAPNIEYPSLI